MIFVSAVAAESADLLTSCTSFSMITDPQFPSWNHKHHIFHCFLLLIGQSAESRTDGEDAVDFQRVIHFEAFPVLIHLQTTHLCRTLENIIQRVAAWIEDLSRTLTRQEGPFSPGSGKLRSRWEADVVWLEGASSSWRLHSPLLCCSGGHWAPAVMYGTFIMKTAARISKSKPPTCACDSNECLVYIKLNFFILCDWLIYVSFKPKTSEGFKLVLVNNLFHYPQRNNKTIIWLLAYLAKNGSGCVCLLPLCSFCFWGWVSMSSMSSSSSSS